MVQLPIDGFAQQELPVLFQEFRRRLVGASFLFYFITPSPLPKVRLNRDYGRYQSFPWFTPAVRMLASLSDFAEQLALEPDEWMLGGDVADELLELYGVSAILVHVCSQLIRLHPAFRFLLRSVFRVPP
jgi:hypothetical protein